MKSIEIMTCNSMYQDGDCVGGYHEIHNINYLQKIDHIIATIDSVVKNNMLYGCDDTVLESVSVFCCVQSVVDAINEHYKGFCGKIKIEARLILMP